MRIDYKRLDGGWKNSVCGFDDGVEIIIAAENDLAKANILFD
jgi:hypothetical protein